MKKIIHIKITLIFVLLVLSISMKGQNKSNSPATYEQMKSKSQWLYSSNSAGLFLDHPINYTELGILYDSYSGNFHRPQEGENGNQLNFNVKGGTLVGKIYAWGSFNYVRETLNDVNFNASIIDPFRGMPYITADTNLSKWNNQKYDMTFRVATPKIGNKWSLGIEGNYKAVSGAKQRDIRTENYYYSVQIKPGVVYSITETQHLGVNFNYYNLKEESNASNVNTYIDQVYYELYGLGAAVQRIGSGRSADYTGNCFGGGLQYNYQGALNLLFSADYAFKVEDVKIGFTNPQDDSSVKDQLWNAKLQAYKTISGLTHYLTLNYDDRKIDGIECLTEYDNTASLNGYVTVLRDVRSKYKTQTAQLDYDLTVDKSGEYDWKFGAGVKYSNQEDLYLAPRSVKNAENLTFQLRAKKNIFLSGNSLERRLLLAADGSYNENLSGGYEYNGSHPDYIVVNQLERVDAYYLNANFWSLGCSVSYSQKIKQNIPANLFVKAEYRYTKVMDSDMDLVQNSKFDNRTGIQLSVGCNF